MKIVLDFYLVVEIAFVIASLLAALAYPWVVLAREDCGDQARPRPTALRMTWHLE